MKKVFDTLKNKAIEAVQEIKDSLLCEFSKLATPRTRKTTKSETYVFITLKGKKFHYQPNCSGLHGAKTIKMNLSKAKKAGYIACDKCCYSYLHD